MIVQGDCLEVLRDLPDGCVTAIVTDPPYGLEFMGKGWDKVLPPTEVWREALRVLRPGGHALIFGGTRTYHRLACAVEDAGFEVRDCLMWLTGQGFPKSLNVSKAIDKAAGAEREIVGHDAQKARQQTRAVGTSSYGDYAGNLGDITAPATDAARLWSGYGTALKPAWEPILLARKPLVGTVERNCREHGTGALNIEGCRISTSESLGGGAYAKNPTQREQMWGEDAGNSYRRGGAGDFVQPIGRWPANLILDEEAASQLGDESRFFYCAKASKSDRGDGNTHPTVKPVELMRWLVRLVKGPQDNLILDPFAGSGTTGVACQLEDVPFLLIEREAQYVEIIRSRLQEIA